MGLIPTLARLLVLLTMGATSCAPPRSEPASAATSRAASPRVKLDNVRLLVMHFRDTFRFYRDVMGCTVTYGREEEPYAHFACPGGGEVAIFSRHLMADAIGTSSSPPAPPAPDAFVLVFEVPNVDQFVQKLGAQRIPVVTPPTDRRDWGLRVAHFRDPEGNLVEAMSPLPK